ncbi:transcriptional regulator, partial [Pseudomonas sp. 91RF]|uniref:AlgP family protein n=1 Tax=Pseudomonas sp. 91RF TaxID=2292261 RepID=UPI000EBAF0CA
MSATKKPVNTPLHLLQQLSGSLLEHLENACSQALADAEKLLAKLEKQRGKAQEKLHKSRTKLQDAATAGKAKAQTKAKAAVKELEDLLDALKDRQSDTRSYILQLKRDAQESLKLAQGVGRVQEAVGKALSLRSAKPAAAPAKKTAAKPAAKAPAKAPVKAAAKPAAKKPAAASAAKPCLLYTS